MSENQLKMMSNLIRAQQDASLAIQNGQDPYQQNYKEGDISNNREYGPQANKKQQEKKAPLSDEQKLDINLWILSRRRNWPSKKRIQEKEEE